jgi:hypothetical protein
MVAHGSFWLEKRCFIRFSIGPDDKHACIGYSLHGVKQMVDLPSDASLVIGVAYHLSGEEEIVTIDDEKNFLVFKIDWIKWSIACVKWG